MMSYRLSNVVFVSLVLSALVALSAPAYGADNAAVTGDGAVMLDAPSGDGKHVMDLKAGNRVEVIGVTDFSQLIDGVSAPWYLVTKGDTKGFVFGTYVQVDAGVTVPSLDSEAIKDLTQPPYPNANAAITGDSVRVRSAPSPTAHVLEAFNTGYRVEVTGVTDFSDTIDGYTAPWYRIKYGKYDAWAYVFGNFVKLDAGVTVPEETPTHWLGLGMFGSSEDEVIEALGQPVSRDEKRFAEGVSDGHRLVFGNDRLDFGGVVAEFNVVADGTDIWKITYKDSAHSIGGLKVGCAVSDVKSLLGSPDIEGSDLIVYNFNSCCPISFTIRSGVVIEISFESVSQG